MYHSITFGGAYNSWDDWHLTPTVLPVVTPPVERMIQVKVSGRNGKADLSQSAGGVPVFEMREGSWSFYVDWESWSADPGTPSGTKALAQISYLLSKLGRFTSVVLEDEPQMEYRGRVWMDSGYKQTDNHGVVTIQYSLYPYKNLRVDTDTQLFDDFCFDRDILWAEGYGSVSKTFSIDTKETFYLPPSDRPLEVNITFSQLGVVKGGTAQLFKSGPNAETKVAASAQLVLPLSQAAQASLIDTEWNDPAYDKWWVEVQPWSSSLAPAGQTTMVTMVMRVKAQML